VFRAVASAATADVVNEFAPDWIEVSCAVARVISAARPDVFAFTAVAIALTSADLIVSVSGT
jgi:hypothetical protein